MTTAIHYSSVKKPPKDGQIYGLQVAVLDWLAAFMRHARQERLVFLIDSEAARGEIIETAARAGADSSRLVFLDARFPQNLVGIDRVFRSDSDPHDLLWQRNFQSGADFSFCGLAHAIAGREAGAILEAYRQAPVTQADAIICPSHAIKDAIEKFWAHYDAFLAARYGVRETCSVRLPVLPLGVDTGRIAARCAPEKRAAQRAALGLADEDVAVLWVGRLSYAIKAHPLAMFRAVDEAARRTARPLRLLMQGYFVPDEAKEEFAALAQSVCTSARVDFIAADDPRFSEGLWAAGDLFLSLIDNMQESFGLTPIEAIAARLPRVLSDWDGYRDHVRDGHDGFLIPTTQPPSGMGDDLASVLLGGRESYGGYLGKTAQCVAVDHEAAAAVIARLAEYPSLRARGAQAALARLPDYDWSRLIPAYEQVWEEGGAARKGLRRLPFVHPHAPDPFRAYEGFASRALSPEERFTLALSPEAINALLRQPMNTLAADMMVEMKHLSALLSALGKKGGLCVAEAQTLFSSCDRARLWRTFTWLAKLGVIRRE